MSKSYFKFIFTSSYILTSRFSIVNINFEKITCKLYDFNTDFHIPDKNLIKFIMIKEYDRLASKDYAQKWALSKNPNYYYFGEIGGDCTNFISQCLFAGGCLMNYDYINGWYYISQSDRSPSWTSVEYLQKFLLRNTKNRGPFANISPLEFLEIGDIIQLKQGQSFTHTLFISQIDSENIYVCAHSDQALNRPLSSYFYDKAIGLHINGSYI